MNNKYPHRLNLHYCLRQLEQALNQPQNLEFLRDFGQCSPLTFYRDVRNIIDALEKNK